MSDEKDWEKAIQEQEAKEAREKELAQSHDNDDEHKDLWDVAMSEQNEVDSQIMNKPIPSKVGEKMHADEDLAPMEMANIAQEVVGGMTQMDKNILSDIPLTLKVVVGKTKVRIRDLLRYTQGSIVELDSTQDSPFLAEVEGRVVAKGDIVVINNKFGIRLTEVVTPKERLESKKDLL